MQELLDDDGPLVPHDEAMAHVKRVIKEAAARSRPTMDETKTLDPRVSEFETQEQAESYDRWVRKIVQELLDDNEPLVPHDQVMAEMRAIIDTARERHKKRES